MFTLIKLAIDAAVAFAFFVIGVKVAVAYPGFATTLDKFLSWAKSQA